MFFTEFSEKIYDIKRTRTCHPATSCVRDQHATTAPARHMWEIGSLNWAQFMLQWFISFSEFTEFSESSAPFRKNSNGFDSFSNKMDDWVYVSPSQSSLALYKRVSCFQLSNCISWISKFISNIDTMKFVGNWYSTNYSSWWRWNGFL